MNTPYRPCLSIHSIAFSKIETVKEDPGFSNHSLGLGGTVVVIEDFEKQEVVVASNTIE